MQIIDVDENIRDIYNKNHGLIEDRVTKCSYCGAILQYSRHDIGVVNENSKVSCKYVVCPYCENKVIVI